MLDDIQVAAIGNMVNSWTLLLEYMKTLPPNATVTDIVRSPAFLGVVGAGLIAGSVFR